MVKDPVDAQLSELVHELWSQIIESINHVVEADSSFGFEKFVALANPSIDQIIAAIQLVEPIVSVVLNSSQIQDDPTRTMQLLNCQQAIHLIRRTHVSLKNGDEAEYQDCIRKLRSQKQ
ncbi:hypothetical protein IMW82_12465 [Rhodanobacter sp. B2A1Ga4]|uniref:hypothetical protein n=1 Tax=Rhodanobacter sp. B2A1Ga4 TaxID=2778647 RepID=UPI001B379C91|nr:hypothetical protein [Rhodanobacter sp. B2A1Ga4]MBQ4855482.1 hypothetical protein [Rhodanobacter sp. B2A1Ga4]